jgi:hypothetical protein
VEFSRPQVVLQCFEVAWMYKGILWHAQHATKTWRHYGSTLVELALSNQIGGTWFQMLHYFGYPFNFVTCWCLPTGAQSVQHLTQSYDLYFYVIEGQH